jgi:hypothetical protein
MLSAETDVREDESRRLTTPRSDLESQDGLLSEEKVLAPRRVAAFRPPATPQPTLSRTPEPAPRRASSIAPLLVGAVALLVAGAAAAFTVVALVAALWLA